MTQPSRPLDHADLALTVMLQDAASGRRVLWIGDFTTGAPERLAEVAHEVCVLDTSGRSVRGRDGGVQRKNYTQGDLQLEGHYDLIVVPEVEVLSDLAARLLELREALGDGLLVIGSGTDVELYKSTWSALDADFREVQLFGQSRFSAAAFANLEGGMMDAALDASLIGGETEPVARYVYLAGDELPKQSSLLVVQTRATPIEVASNHREVDALRDELKRASSRLKQAQVRLVATEAELSEAQASLRTVPEESEESAFVFITETPDVQDQVQREHEEARQALGRSRLIGRIATMKTEAQRRALVLRDVTEELGEWVTGRRAATLVDSAPAAVTSSESNAARALDTEAALAAAEFTIDELRAEIALLEKQTGDVSAQASDQVAAQQSAQESAKNTETLKAQLADVEAQLTEEQKQRSASIDELADLKRVMLDQAAAMETGEAVQHRLIEVEASLLVANAEALRLAAAQAATVAQLKTAEGKLDAGEDAGAKAGVEATETIANQRIDLERLRGQTEGLRFRLRDAQASAKAAIEARDKSEASLAQLDRLDDLQEEVEQLRQTDSEQTLRLVDLTHERDAIERASMDVRSALAARDALMTRLQMELAQQENANGHQDQRLGRLTEEVERLRSGIVEAAGAVDSRDAALAKVVELEAAAVHQAAALNEQASLAEAQREQDSETEALRDTLTTLQGQAAEGQETQASLEKRALAAEEKCNALEERVVSLSEFRGAAETALVGARRVLDNLRVETATGHKPRHTITAAGIEAPSGPDRQFKREIEDKDTLLRSLTAQLEERDDRIRAFTRRLEGEDAGVSDLELEERSIRLKEELFHERAARKAADERVQQLIQDNTSSSAEDVEKRLEVKSAAFEAEQARRQSLETDVSSLRSACTKARQGLESLLEEADADDEAARQLGALVDILTRF